MALYFDDPKSLANENEMRMIWGFAVQEYMSEAQIEEILRNDKNLKYIKGVPKCSCIESSFPHRNNFSYTLGAMKVYPALHNFQSEHTDVN